MSNGAPLTERNEADAASDTSLPAGFSELERFVADWAKPTRAERYATRLAKDFDETGEFYDAVAARAEDAIIYLNGLDLYDLPADAERLLWLLYSLILVSYAVNLFKQPHIPDAGAAFFDQIVEPAV
jgi:hypothetical protein